jgi:hypothetical protein
MAYGNFLLKVGLYGSPLQWQYDKYGTLLAGATWFHNLWQLVSLYRMEVCLCLVDKITGIQENNHSLMDEFYQIGYRVKRLEFLNIVHPCCNLLYLSDILKCDRITLDEFVISDMAEESARHTFPREEPLPSHFTFWKEAIHLVCSGSTQPPCILGRFVSRPHLPSLWHMDTHSTILYLSGGNNNSPTYKVYTLRQGRMGTRFGQKYNWSSSKEGPHLGTHYASVTMISKTCAELHFSAFHPEPIILPTSFLDVLHSYSNIGLWEHLTIDGDGEWIREGIIRGSLVCAHDGSYMALEVVDLSSAGVIVFCASTKQWLKASLVERSTFTSNYCGKLLGALMSLLILRAASSFLLPPLHLVVLHCDNHVVITHGNSPLTSLPEKTKTG